MVKIVLFALICVSSLSSIAKASNEFYFSASSLTSKENTSITQQITNSNITYTENMVGLDFAPRNFESYLQFTSDNPGAYFQVSADFIQNTFILNGDTTLLLYANTYNVTMSSGATTVEYIYNPNNKMYAVQSIKGTDYTAQIATVQSMMTTPPFTINNTGGFELSTGYKFQNENSIFFIAPQIDYSQFGSNNSSLRNQALSAVTKIGIQYKNPYRFIDLYGFIGASAVQNSSNNNTQNIGGLKYGIGTEVAISKNIALFAEIFQIDLANNRQSVTYSPSTAVVDYINANSNPEQVIITNNDQPQYKITLNQLGLKHYIDPNSLKVEASTNITNITGFKVGITAYLWEEESYY
jgi:hypothetical protein